MKMVTHFTNRAHALAITLLLAAGVIGGSGCAAVKATQQPGKKNLQVLNTGTPRTRVIAELGTPTWSEERGETAVDVFAFKQGYTKGVKASRALVHGAADVVTGGLWEVVGIPAESLADGTDVKVEVTYDAQREVSSIEIFEGQDAVTPRKWWRRKPMTSETVAQSPQATKQR